MANWRMATGSKAKGYRSMECTALDGGFRDLDSEIVDTVYGGESGPEDVASNDVIYMTSRYS